MSQTQIDIAIVGAGIAGLSAATHLQNVGLKVKIFEASDAVGGRVRTDKVNGFLLDRGFQVFLTAYPQAQRILDYESLTLKTFFPGALVQYQGKNYRMADPFRKPLGALTSLFSPISNWGDKLKILALRNRHKRLTIKQLFVEPETSTLSFLKKWNFSKQIIDTFFRPFLGGIFLDTKLETSSRMFEFVFKMFSEGYAALPADGMKAIPEQLASQLEEKSLFLNTKVREVNSNKLILESGEELSPKLILIATDALSASRLVPDYQVNTATYSTTCFYFSSSQTPIREPILWLNGHTKDSWINHICVPSIVNPNYAPPAQYLISVNVIKVHELGEEALLEAVQKELESLFPDSFRYWQHLKTYTIQNALPKFNHIQALDKQRVKPIKEGIYICGDHTAAPSLNAAMESGHCVAEAMSWDLALNNHYVES